MTTPTAKKGKGDHTQCACGNFFMDDSKFCRKCGTRRPDIDPSPAKKRKVTPAAAAVGGKKRPWDGCADSAKSAKPGGPEDIKNRIKNVADAMDDADGRTDPCKHMLHNTVPMSLGTPVKGRTADQVQASKIVGKALQGINSSLRDDVALKESAYLAAADKAKELEGKKLSAERAAKTAKDDLERRGVGRERAATLQAEKEDASDKAKEAHDRTLDDLALATREKQDIDDLYNNHFLPLRNGKCTTLTQAKPHLNSLENPLKDWGIEDCLHAGFKAAAPEKPADRGPHCKICVDETEKLFDKPKKNADAKVRAAKALADKAANEAARALKDAEDAAKARALADERIRPAEQAQVDAQDKLDDADQKARDANTDADIAKGELDTSKQCLDDFKKGPQTDYDYLMKHNVPGYDPSSLPKASDPKDAKGPEDKKRVDNAKSSLRKDPTCDPKDRDMLSDMAPGCLGPKKDERDPLQKEAVEMIKNKLNGNLNDLEEDIDDLANGAYSSDCAPQAVKDAVDKAIAAGKSPEEVCKIAAATAKKAGASTSLAAKLAGKSTADAAMKAGMSPADVAKKAAACAKGNGGSPEDIADVAADAAARAALAAGLSPSDAGKIAADAVKAVGGSPADAARAAAKAAAKVAKKNGANPAGVGKAACAAAKAAGGSPSVSSLLSGEAAGDAALEDGLSPAEVVKAAEDACKACGGSADDIAKAGNLMRAKIAGKAAADAVKKNGGDPFTAAKAAGKAAADAARAAGLSPAEQAKAAADAARAAGGSPSDIAKAAGRAAADAAIAAGKSPAEVGRAAAEAAKAAGGSPEDIARIAGDEAGRAARLAGKSPAEVGKAAADAAKAAGGSPWECARAAGKNAGKAAEEAGKSVDEVGKAAGDAAKAAGGSPGDVTRAINAAKLADALKNDPDEAPKIADTIVKNRTKDVEDAEKKKKEVCGGECGKARKALEDAKFKVRMAEDKIENLNDMYEKHFLPLKNGAGSSKAIKAHLDALMPYFDEYGLESCLKAGFPVAVSSNPESRGVWDKMCVEEVGKTFMTPKKLAADALAAAKFEVKRAERNLESAEEDCHNCEIALLRALEELKSAKLLREKVRDLNATKEAQGDIHDE